MTLLSEGLIISNDKVSSECFRMELLAADAAAAARPGQFFHVRCADSLDPLLRRPLSICSADREAGGVTFLYRQAGRGTTLLAQKKPGEAISLLGPLGRGFTMPGGEGRPAVVAGGIGVAPLFFLLKELAGGGAMADVFIGATSSGGLLLVEEMKALGHAVHLSTDDGSAGYHGLVTALFEKYIGGGGSANRKGLETDLTEIYIKALQAPRTAFVYACGPVPMMRGVAEISLNAGLPCEVSLEERMGCGVGACLACACKTKNQGGGFAYRRVCADGPVFPAEEVVWE